MRGRNFIYIGLIWMFVVSATIIGAVRAPVIPKIYVDPPTATAQPGETFTVDIKITDVTTPGVSGWELMIRFDFSLIHTEAAWITEGDFLKNIGMTMFAKAEKPAESAWLLGSALMIPATASGSGTLATIQFEVQGEGKTPLELIKTDLRDIDVMPIEHTVEHGYFSNIVVGNLVRKSAWPEHHHFSISKDEDGIQTLYGKVKNLGEGHGYLRVNFTIWDMGGIPVTFIAKHLDSMGDELKIMPGEIVDISIGLWESRETAWLPGRYSVKATCIYSADGTTWHVGTKVKAFSFSIVS